MLRPPQQYKSPPQWDVQDSPQQSTKPCRGSSISHPEEYRERNEYRHDSHKDHGIDPGWILPPR
jgi:hypothetical protein